MGRYTIVHATGKQAAAEAVADCGADDVVIVNVELAPTEACEVYDVRRLRDTGSLAIRQRPEAPEVVTAQDVGGRRLWSP